MPDAFWFVARVLVALALGVVVCVGVGGCSGGNRGGGEITVFAASSLTEAFGELAREFEAANPGSAVKLNFAGSQRLRFQLEQGAEADVFASADEGEMQMVVEAGLVSGETRHFASSAMAVIAAADSSVRRLGDLTAPGVRVVLAHESVPAGRYSRRLLEHLSGSEAGLGSDFAEGVLANLVSEETTVKFVEQKVVLGEADAGIVYRPGMLTATSEGGAREVPLPASAGEVVARFPVAALGESERPELAERFIGFLLSLRGGEILAGYGFGPP